MKIHPEARIGHVHLTVADLDRSLAFYRDLLGFEVTARYGDEAVFLSAGGYHHHIGLNTWNGKGATPPPRGHSGIYHHAILYRSPTPVAKDTESHGGKYPSDRAAAALLLCRSTY